MVDALVSKSRTAIRRKLTNIGVLAALSAVLLFPEHSMSASKYPEGPPFQVIDEATADPNIRPFDRCRELTNHLARGMGAVLGVSEYTRSDRWGPVMRVEFTMKNENNDGRIVTKMICWRP